MNLFGLLSKLANENQERVEVRSFETSIIDDGFCKLEKRYDIFHAGGKVRIDYSEKKDGLDFTKGIYMGFDGKSPIFISNCEGFYTNIRMGAKFYEIPEKTREKIFNSLGIEVKEHLEDFVRLSASVLEIDKTSPQPV